MGGIRIVGPGKTHGYPYSVCKKRRGNRDNSENFFLFLIESICYDPSLEPSIGKIGQMRGHNKFYIIKYEKVSSIFSWVFGSSAWH